MPRSLLLVVWLLCVTLLPAARALPTAASPFAQSAPACDFALGFAALRTLAGTGIVRECVENERFDAINGNATQRTTSGLLVWRKADNWTAFTDGFHSWVNGPNGLRIRLNSERFPWEADAAGFPPPARVEPGRVEPGNVLLAAGDIAGCPAERLTGAFATARLLESHPGTVAPLGDLAYDSGTDAEFAQCYGPTWGRLIARTRPAPGNHEYGTRGAAGYFRYFGAAAGDPERGYYDYFLGTWHILVLNSNCDLIGGCGAGSPQERWLRATLAAQPAQCTLAYMHHPRFSSGLHGSHPLLQPLWQALYDAGADLVLAGHDHNYERFAPQDPIGRPDPVRGIRSFVVGTGGHDHLRPLGAFAANSELRQTNTHGVLKLTLDPGRYAWEFLAVPGDPFRDTGAGQCH